MFSFLYELTIFLKAVYSTVLVNHIPTMPFKLFAFFYYDKYVKYIFNKSGVIFRIGLGS